jgi:hypothetical protein
MASIDNDGWLIGEESYRFVSRLLRHPLTWLAIISGVFTQHVWPMRPLVTGSEPNELGANVGARIGR